MSSRRRPYLDLKKSFLEQFRGRARWLHDTMSKESIFEKPYLDEDYRQMHLNMPEPRWGRRGPAASPGMWPQTFVANYVLPFPWCSSWVWSPARCGESFSGSGSIRGTGVNERNLSFIWTVNSSEERVQVTKIEPSLRGQFMSFEGEINSEYEGTVTFTVTAEASSRFMKSHQAEYTIPAWFMVHVARGASPTAFASRQRFDGTNAWGTEARPGIFNVTYYEPTKFICQTDITVRCCNASTIAWDTTISAETIARSASAVIAITDTLSKGEPFYWSVSGTGFTVESAVTDGLGNKLLTNASACGTATVTVTGCDGTAVTGEVRCTDGSEWVLKSSSDSSCYDIQDCNADCSKTYSGVKICDVITGKTKVAYTYRWWACGFPPNFNPPCTACVCEDMPFPPCYPGEPGGTCHAYKYSTYEWECTP